MTRRTLFNSISISLGTSALALNAQADEVNLTLQLNTELVDPSGLHVYLFENMGTFLLPQYADMRLQTSKIYTLCLRDEQALADEYLVQLNCDVFTYTALAQIQNGTSWLTCAFQVPIGVNLLSLNIQRVKLNGAQAKFQVRK